MAERHGITAEEIAREAADGAVGVTRRGLDGSPTWCVSVCGKVLPQHHDFPDAAENHAREMRNLLDRLVLAALERFAREVPVPSPLSAGRAAEVAAGIEEEAGRQERAPKSVYRPPAVTDQELLMLAWLLEYQRDNAHLRRALHDCGLDGSAAVWSAGYEAGRWAMAEEVAAARAGGAPDDGPHDRMPHPSGPGKLGL